MSSTDLDRPSVVSTALDLPPEHRATVSEYLGIEPDDPSLPAYLATCEQYGLNPFLGQVWLIETQEKIKDAQGRETQRKRKRVAAGRDGYLAIAQRTGLFKGVQSDVVCQHDTFEVDWGTDPEKAPIVRHSYSPTEEDRGEIIGAWAKSYRRDAYPVFYFARLKEHGKVGHGQSGVYWKGAWSYTSAMILKAAQSYAMRIAFSITGVTPVDEMRDDEDDNSPQPSVARDEGVPWPEDPELRHRLIAAVTEANEREPNAYTTATLQMMLGGQSDEQLRAIATTIEQENEVAAEHLRLDALLHSDTAQTEPESTDAEVAEDELPVRTDEENERIRELYSDLQDLYAAQQSATEDDEKAAIAADIETAEFELGALGETP